MNDPFSKMVKSVRFILNKYDPRSESAAHFAKLKIPVRCACCSDYYNKEDPDKVELLEIVSIIEQKILLPDDIVSSEYLDHPVVIFYCKHCLETLFGGRRAEDLPFYQ